MVRIVKKRNGTRERFNLVKLAKWGEWAAQGIEDRVNWSAVMVRLAKSQEKEIESRELHLRAITFLLRKKTWAANLMAGRLLAPMLYKETYGQEKPPSVKELHAKLLGLKLLRPMQYSDEEYAEIESIIDHERDKQMVCFQIKQIYYKYGLRSTKKKTKKKTYHETPQFVYMRMAMALAEDEPTDRMVHLKKFYEHFSSGRINAPTPNYVNLGTPHRGLASCCLYTCNDTTDSLLAGDAITYEMTVQSAGIGGYIATRSEGDDVREGTITHQGRFPYLSHHSAASLANTQGGRGGALNEYFVAYDPQAMELIMTQNPRTPVEKQMRKLHFTIMTNRFLHKKVLENGKVFTWNIKSAPELHEAFFSGDEERFKEVYEKLELDVEFEKNYVNARQLILTARQQSVEVSTLYRFNTDYANHHTPFKEPIHSSNLCVAPETMLLTDNGQQTIKTLEGKTVNIWNGEEWSEVTVVKTGKNKTLWRVTLSNGRVLDCTPEHKWYVQGPSSAYAETRTHELEEGDILIDTPFPDGNVEKGVTVMTVKNLGRVDDTYCVREEKRHMAVFNGILTGQCVEIYQPTAPYEHVTDLYKEEDHGRGEVSLCALGGIVITKVESDEQYEDTAYYTLKMIDKCIHQAEYRLPHVGFTAKQRMNAGVGILGLAHHMAMKGLTYNCEMGYREIHKVSERHMYFLMKGSLRLGRELGNAPWIHKTKWPEGWTPLSTYNKAVDEIATFKSYYDIEGLSKEIVENGGIRNSVLCSHMPTESSSKAAATTNSMYAIRELALLKTDAKASLDWCAPDNDILGTQYQRAYEIPPVDMMKVYGIVQKHTDGGISADLYRDRSQVIEIKTSALLDEEEAFHRYCKGQYYYNTLTPVSSDEDVYGTEFSQNHTDDEDDDDALLDGDLSPVFDSSEALAEGMDASGACVGGSCTL